MKVTHIHPIDDSKSLERPLVEAVVPAGFPSPAENTIDTSLDLNKALIKHPAATFYVRVSGSSMIGAGIHDGDLLIVDRSIRATDKKVIIAIVDGDLTVKRMRIINGNPVLFPENDDFPNIEPDEFTKFEVWGVVTYVIHPV